MLIKRLICFASFFLLASGQNAWSAEEETAEYWYDKSQQELKVALGKETLNTLVARNVILFLGDGMGIPSVTAGRILKGQLRNQSGEEFVLAMDKFPHAALSKTYCTDRQVSDSAATATAYLSGIKTNRGTIGVTSAASRRDCESSKGNEVDSILVDSFNAGKSTGIVTTTSLAHASPAGAYAHSADRQWYSDGRLNDGAVENGCKDIAMQFFERSHMITVALGGGRQHFQPNSTADPEYPLRKSERNDGRDLVQEWKDAAVTETRAYVWNKDDFDKVNPVETDRLWGMFEPYHMQYVVDRDPTMEPSLAEMTEKAIQMLQKNSNGYFLFVEGGRIDQGHHDANANSAIHEVVTFDDAIARAVEMTSESDTLIVVTADHSHTMSIGGYAVRGNPILGRVEEENGPELAKDGKPFTTLLYGNGVGYQSMEKLDRARQNLTDVDTGRRVYLQQSGVPMASESHGGDDVAILARGPMSHLFHGVHEQTYIAYVMRYASCVGDNQDHCANIMEPASAARAPFSASFLGYELTTTAATAALYAQFVLVLCLAFFLVFLAFIVFSAPSSVAVVRSDKIELANGNGAYVHAM